MSALRKLAAGQRTDSYRIGQFLTGLEALPAERYSHTPLLGRIWELRHNFTAYDATYIALAEATNAVLYMCYEKLRTGHRIFEIVRGSVLGGLMKLAIFRIGSQNAEPSKVV